MTFGTFFESFGTFWDVLGRLGRFLDVLERFGALWDVSGRLNHPKIIKIIPKSSQIVPKSSPNAYVFREKVIKINVFKGSNRSKKLRLKKCCKNHIQSLDFDKIERGL